MNLYSRASEMGLEGIVSKRADAPYRSGHSQQWFKVKSWRRERFAVVGYVPEGSHGLLKLRLARQEGGALVYVGRVGTGWDRKTAREIRRALEPLARPRHPSPIRSRKRTRHGLSRTSMLRLPMPNLPMMEWFEIRRSRSLSRISFDGR